MKKFQIALLFVAWAFVLQAATVEKVYYFKDYQIISKGEFQSIRFANTMLSGLAGEPALPYCAVSLLLPPGESAVAIEVIGEKEVVVLGSYKLYPYQESQTLNDDSKHRFLINETLYSTDMDYPLKPAGKLLTQYMNGYAFALSSFTPVHYNPEKGELRYYTKVKVRIITRPDDKALEALENLHSSGDIFRRVSRLAQNKKMLDSYPPGQKSDGDYQLLIITTDAYENSFDDLRAIYLPRGIRSEVVTKSYILSNMSGQDAQEKIRNYIKQEYQDHNIEYVLLGGDVELIPYRGFYCHVQSGSGYDDNGIPADLYYSALDGNWNTDNDSHWGEPGEDDLLPEIGVARFPFSNMTELNNLKHKSISYQDSPVLGEFTSPLLAGEYLYGDPETWGSDYLELLRGYHDDNGYTTIGIPETNNIETLYEHDGSWSGSDLRAKINSGKQFVHHVGHANETMVAHLSISDITNSNFSGANGVNHNFTFLHTHGCNCGSFDSNDCILEKMVTIQNFAAAVIGNSRYGWFNEGQTEGPAAHLHREMVDALYHEKLNHLGAAFVEAKTQTAPWVTAPGQWEEGALRWNFYDLNILGDPALSVLTDEPESITTTYENTFPIGVNTMAVNVSKDGMGLENMTCVLLKDGVIYAQATTSSNGDATLVLSEPFNNVGTAQLVVSGYNCLPTYYPVDIVPNEGAYVTLNSFTVNDSNGNNNGNVDYGEEIQLNVVFENVGSQDASGVTATLSTTDDYVTINTASVDAGNIGAGETLNLLNAFSFTVQDDVPDMHLISFQIEFVSDNNDSWESGFALTAYAPFFTINEMTVDDSESGNGDGILDPGETADISISTTNSGHAGAFDLSALLQTGSEYLSINEETFFAASLEAGSSLSAVFSIEADADTPDGTPAILNYSVQAGSYNSEGAFSLVIGEVPVFLMENGSATLCAGKFYDTGGENGEYGNDEDLVLTFYPGSDNAKIKVNFQSFSVEGSYDFLYIHDGENTDAPQVTGSPFTGVTLPQEILATNDAGAITFHFTSDYSVTSSGWDADVSCEINTAADVVKNADGFRVFPNPAADILYISSPSPCQATLYNLLGENMKTISVDNDFTEVDISGLKQGIYFLRFDTSQASIVKKIEKR